MLTRLRSVLRRPFVRREADAGFTLIEVVVSMFVFMIIALAILSGVVLSQTTSANAQARQTATNLATAAINVARTTKDLNDLGSSMTTQTVAGHTYTVQTTARWAPSTTGVTTQCSTGTGAILGKSVEVSVSWSGAGGAQTPVTQTTLVASGSTVTQIGNGSIMVQVTNAQGQPFTAGAVLDVETVSDTGASIPDPSSVPATVDSQGCAFVPNLVPGNYTVAIGTTYNGVGDPFVDTDDDAVSTQTVSVTANAMTTATYTYDQSTPVAVVYGPGTATLPNGIEASFIHDGTISVPNGGCMGAAATYCLFPYPNGYTVVAGDLGSGTTPGCESVDPTQWQADASYAKGTATTVVTDPGTQITVQNLPMGTFSLAGLTALSGGAPLTISAQQLDGSAADPADPGCATAVVNGYSFPASTSSTATLALPFGTWQLSYSTSATADLQCTASKSYYRSTYTCTAAGTSDNTAVAPAPAKNDTVPNGASCTGWASYTCKWSMTAGTTALLPDANIVAPSAPSVYSGGKLTLDPRAAATS